MNYKNLTRRKVLQGTVLGLSLSGLGVNAQSYPNSKPVKIIVPFAPGGTTDILARLIGKHLQERLGVLVNMENRTGAGGSIGADAVAKSIPDGHTLVMGSIGTHATNSLIYPKMPYDSVSDFAPIAMAGSATLVLVVHPSLGVTTVNGLIDLLRNKPNIYSYASGGIAASQHLAGELFKYATGVSMQHIAYKGSAGALTDLLSGRVPIMFADLPLVLPHIQSGALRALAVADPEPSPALPGIPTVSQSGVTGYVATAWYALFAPAKTPGPVLVRLQTEVVDILKLPELRKVMLDQGVRPGNIYGEELRKFQENEISRWRASIKAANIQTE